MELKELYQEIILDHGKNPRNKGKCSGYSHDAQAHNTLCGDKVHIYLKLDKEKKILDSMSKGKDTSKMPKNFAVAQRFFELTFTKKLNEKFKK